jgi:hypothetical protein
VTLPSSTQAPLTDNTFKKPIVAAEFSQNRFDQSSAVNILPNVNLANTVSQPANYRILSNQASAEFPQHRAANKLLINQASGSSLRGSSNKVLKNEASENFASRGLNNRVLNHQTSPNIIFQSPSSGIVNNQNSREFNYRTASNKLISNFVPEKSYSVQNQGFNGQRTLIGSNVITSIGGANFDNDFITQNRENLKIISEFDGAINKNFSGKYQSTTAAPEVTTYTGEFSRMQGRIVPNSRNQNNKVIVKLSDLHPLILGKLSAECTCKADPFAIFRGPSRQTLPIKSQNRGQVDLANYDESDIYVDVDSDNENERDIELIKNIPSSRLIKPAKLRLNENESDSRVIIKSRGEPLSTYLPATRTSTLSAYLPPARLSKAYLPSSTEASITPVYRSNQASLSAQKQNRQPLFINVEDGSGNSPVITSRRRSSKSLFDQSVKTNNNLKGQIGSSVRYQSLDAKTTDNSLNDNLECARPGLFRHPKFCNKFYACHWDNWKKRYTLHVFNCPVHLAFDTSAGACNYPSKGPACQDNKLLV